MTALASAPAEAQTLTISASGDCAGTPANCGTSGDRDTTWPGLQVDEGDTVTFRMEVSPASGSPRFTFSLIGTGATSADLGQIRATGSNSFNVSGIPNQAGFNLFPAGGYVQNVVIPVSTDSATEPDESLTGRIDSFLDGVTLQTYPLPSPSSVTVTVRGADSAPSFGSGSVSSKTFTAGAAIVDATGTDTNGCPGTEARKVCGTPTTAAAAQTVTITATDADSNTMNTDRATLTFSVTVNASATLASNPTSLTEDNLDGATLTVTLPSGFTYAAGVSTTSFDLVTSPAIAGLSISTVTSGATGTTAATLILAAGTGYGFNAAAALAVKVLAAAHSGSGDLTTGTLPVAPGAPPGVTVSRTSLSLNEDPGAADANQGTYTLVLDTAPTGCAGGVGVSVASGNPDVTPEPTALTFTATTWNTPQTVTVTAGRDDDGEADNATLRHAVTTACDAAGCPATLAIPSVQVTVADDDAPPPPNQPPVAAGAFGDVDLDPGGSVEVSLPGKFRDPEGGPLTYTAESLNPEVAGATVSNGRLWVDGRSPGLATVFVTAADSGGLRARLAFKVRVGRVLSFVRGSASAPEGGVARLALELNSPSERAAVVGWVL